MRSRSAVVVIVIALATTVVGAGAAFGQTFTDDPLTAATTTVKAVHVTELRTAIASLRALLGLPVFSWTDDPLAPGATLVQAIQIAELRTALDQVYDAFPKLRPTYTDPILTGLVIKAVHLEQLRTAVLNVSNDAPAFTKGADQTVNEDAAAQTIVGWATAISPGPRETTQTVTFVFDTNDNPSLFSAGPSVASNGTLTYTPAANQNGVAQLTLHAHDDGGTSHGGVDNSPTQSFMITVNPINDVPSFTKGADETVLEDTGLHTVVAWATAISPGPNEAGQALTFNITGNTNSALFSVPPAVASNGTLTYTLAANAFGSSTITLTLSDNGGTANGGVDTSASQSFAINVTGINDAPSFTKGSDQTVNEDAGAQTVVGWATGMSAGPSEGSQVVTFVIDTNDNPGLFSAGPAVAEDGTLTYTPAANQNGVANITLHIQDNGGTANGGVDASAPQSFVITVNAVNDAPTVTNKTYGPNAVQANMKMIGLTGLLGGVTDADSGVNGCSPTFTVAGVSATTPAGGTVTVTNASTGTFDFDPPPGVTGNVTFTYTVQDTGCPGTATSAAATVTVNVAGPVIWFVNPVVVGPGDGRLSNPFKFLTGNAGVFNDADDVDAAGHSIFVYTGTVTGGITLNTSEALIGQGALNSPNTFDALMGITPPAGTIARPSIGGTRPTVSNTSGTAITLGSSNTVKGLNVTNSGGSGITGSAVGTLTLADFDVTVTGGSALSATTSGTVTATGTDNDLTATNGTALNVNAVIGGANLTFKSIASNGGGTAIGLANTGAGQLIVTGTGTTAGSGGTIENKVGVDAITLNTTGGLITLKNMIIEDITAAADGTAANGTRSNVDAISGLAVSGGLTVDGTTIRRISDNAILGGTNGIPDVFTTWNGLTINNSTIEDTNRFNVTSHGDATSEGAVRILGLSGTVIVTNSLFQRGAEFLDLTVTGNMTMTVTGSQFLQAYKEFVAGNNSPQASVGLHGVDVTVRGTANATITIGDRDNAALGNTFLNGRLASLRVGNDVGASGNIDVTGGRNLFKSDDHSSGVSTGGPADFDFPQAGVLMISRGLDTATWDVIMDNNYFDEATNASGGVGQLTLDMSRGVWQALITRNTFDTPGNAPWFIRAELNAITAKVKFKDNIGIRGFFVSPDPSAGGGYFGPGLRSLADVQNGGKLDLTIDGDDFAKHDNGFDPGQTVEVRRLNVGAAGTINVHLLNNTAPDGYALENFDAAGSVNLFRGASASSTPATIVLNNNNLGGAGVATTTPPTVTTFGTITATNTAPQVPALTPLLFDPGRDAASRSLPVAAANVQEGVGGQASIATAAAPSVNVDGGVLSQADLDSIVAAALARWTATGLTNEQLATLRRLKFDVADLLGWYLGKAGGNRIRVDNNAGGNGWFIGSTAKDDALFAKGISATRRYTDPASAPAGRVDLLTAVMHEMGHALGLPDSYAEEDRDSLMYGYLTAGERRIPDRSLTRTRSR